MPFRYSAFSIFVLSIIMIVSVVNSTPVPALDLDKLTDDASLIVQGEASAVRDDTINGVRNRLGKIHPDHFLKGAARSDSLDFRLPVLEGRAVWDPARDHNYGVFFLKPSPSGNFEFADPYYPFLPSFKGEPPTGGAPIDRVVSALSNVLWSGTSTPSQRMAAIFVVSRSKGLASTAALRNAMKDLSPEVQLSAAGALLERNDLTGLNLVVRALTHGSPDTSSPIYHNVLYAMSEGLKNPEVVPALEALLSSGNPEIRRAAASALMHTHSQHAIDPLLTSLEDSDFQTQYYSAVGLAEITGQMDWRPNEDNFRTDRVKYLKHWREWASSR